MRWDRFSNGRFFDYRIRYSHDPTQLTRNIWKQLQTKIFRFTDDSLCVWSGGVNAVRLLIMPRLFPSHTIEIRSFCRKDFPARAKSTTLFYHFNFHFNEMLLNWIHWSVNEGECKKPIRFYSNAIVSGFALKLGKINRDRKIFISIFFFWFDRFRFRSCCFLLPSVFARCDEMSFVSFMAKSLLDSASTQKRNVDKPVNVKEWEFLQPYLLFLIIIITVGTSLGVLSRKMTLQSESILFIKRSWKIWKCLR